MDKPEMFRISEELEAMPELARIQQIDIQKLSYFVFEDNTAELRRVLDFHGDLKQNLPLFDTDNRDSLDALQREIGRLLHNFVASANTLIDTTRRLYEKYENGAFPDYQTKIDSEFVTDPLSRFVKGLRNYAVHYEAPPLISKISFSIGENGNLKSQIVLPSKKLLGFKWDAEAKRYITDCGEEIVLDSVVNDYYHKVSNFYNWFYRRLNEIHEPDLSRINAKKEELKGAYIKHPADGV